MHKISIIPRGRALGYTLVLPTEDRFLATRSELLDEMAMLLGGRTAEELIFADPTTGAHDDIDRATEIARHMVTEFGMSDALGPVRFGVSDTTRSSSAATSATHPSTRRRSRPRIDAEVRRLLDGAHARRPHDPRDEPRRCSTASPTALLEQETLDAAEVEALLASVPKWHGERARLRPGRRRSLRANRRPSGRPLA